MEHGEIFKINEDKLRSSGVEIIDLRCKETRDLYIDKNDSAESIRKCHNFAKKFEEVLLVDKVPKSCFIDD